MALVLEDRVKETTTTTGTGTITLAGAATGFQSFAAIGDGNTTYYAISAGSQWEVGLGTYTAAGTTLSRDTVLASSNAGALVTFSAGTKDVICTNPATKAVMSGTGVFADQFDGTFVDGIVIDHVTGQGRISVGTDDAIKFYNGGVGGLLLGEALTNGDWDFNGTVTVGTGTAIGGVTNPLIEANGNANGYVEIYSHNDNTGSSASADLVVYPDNGADASGWLDIGINSSTFSDAAFSVSTANEGYIFMSALSGASKTGSLVVATDSTGTDNDIQFFTNGFGQAKSTVKMVIKGVTGNVGIRVQSPTASLHLPAGTTAASTAPLKFTSSAGAVLTTAEAGALEYDGKTLFITPEASNRGVAPAYHYITLITSYTTAGGTTALQKMFNSSTNGALTVGGSTTYFFECDFSLSSMNTNSGTFSFGILGTATITRIRYWAISKKAAAGQGTGLLTMGTAATATALSAANTTATGHSTIRGKIVVGNGGTIIPAFAVSVANAVVVDADSSFRIWAAGTNTEVEIGNWS